MRRAYVVTDAIGVRRRAQGAEGPAHRLRARRGRPAGDAKCPAGGGNPAQRVGHGGRALRRHRLYRRGRSLARRQARCGIFGAGFLRVGEERSQRQSGAQVRAQGDSNILRGDHHADR